MSPRPSSSRKADAVLGSLLDDRYAIMALCLLNKLVTLSKFDLSLKQQGKIQHTALQLVVKLGVGSSCLDHTSQVLMSPAV